MANSLLVAFNKDPLKFCTATATSTTWKLVQQVYHVLTKQGDGYIFTNPLVSTKSTSISEQLQCGSCWAQAAIGSFEVALKKGGKFKDELSVQQIIDCVHGAKYPESDGCKGGTPMEALAYLFKHGSAFEKLYPYTARDTDLCRESLGILGPKSYGWDSVHFPAEWVKQSTKDYAPCSTKDCAYMWIYELDLVLSVKNDGPYIGWVDASNWYKYETGLFPPEQCSNTLDAGNHIVELLGFGLKKGIPFWLIKNSWGSKWGMQGFIRLPVGHNACGIINYLGRASPVPFVTTKEQKSAMLNATKNGKPAEPRRPSPTQGPTQAPKPKPTPAPKKVTPKQPTLPPTPPRPTTFSIKKNQQ